MTHAGSLGAIYLGDGRCRFVVWSPRAERVALHLIVPDERVVALDPLPRGYFAVDVDGVAPGTTYRYRLDDEAEWPDPASRSQPDGVHGPSAVVDPAAFSWTDAAWRGVALRDLVIYELHVGTFSPSGTVDGVIPHLDDLRELGVTAIEVMPVAQFPGARNWGYDGVYPYAVQHSYGGPDGLRRLVDACHARGLAVVLDVVYNHLGPEGNYLSNYGPYFTDRYHTPWGDAVNMDGPHSDEVRRYFIDNALHWVAEYHVDGFRLDATDRIVDQSATHFLRALTTAVHELAGDLGRRVWVIAESAANDAGYILPAALNGYGLDAQWGDDFHHALHALLTGERGGYYADFGELWQLAKSFRQNVVYDGLYSRYRCRTHGNAPRLATPSQFVVATQNHDQVGNRATGDRLNHQVSLESARLAAAAVILSPFLPLLFMGEEYAEHAPFQYFTSHGDPALQRAVSEGRRNEFARFAWQGEVPDPQHEATFRRSKLDHDLKRGGGHQAMLAYYRELLRLRRELPALAARDSATLDAVPFADRQVLLVRRGNAEHETALILNFSEHEEYGDLPLPPGIWRRVLDSADTCWQGAGSAIPSEIKSQGTTRLNLRPRSAALLERVPAAALTPPPPLPTLGEGVPGSERVRPSSAPPLPRLGEGAGG
jgi:maltooligosyltrehalose trehalohydrolase